MPTAASALVLFPGALGDFMCFLPTLAALRARHAGRLCLVAQPAFLPLVRMPDLDTVSIDRHVVADLFATGTPPLAETIRLLGGFDTVHSWTGFGNPQFVARLTAISAGPVLVHRFRGMQDQESAVDYYARCAGIVPVEPLDAFIADDPQWMTAWQDASMRAAPGLLVMHPGSGAPRKNWLGFDALCRYWQTHHADRIVILSGPAESEDQTGLAPPGGTEDSLGLTQTAAGKGKRASALGPQHSEPRKSAGAPEGTVLNVRGLRLPQVAALLRRCTLYLGNDSGISHLASAVGARGVVLFGPTDPRIWAPRRGLQVMHSPEACATCGPNVFCTHRLTRDRVINTLEAMRAGPT